MKPEKLSCEAARKAFRAARDALACLVDAPPGWNVECRGDAHRSIGAMMAAARSLPEVLETVSMRGLLLQKSERQIARV